MSQIILKYTQYKSANFLAKLIVSTSVIFGMLLISQSVNGQKIGLEWVNTAHDTITSNTSYYSLVNSNKIIPDELGNVYVVGTFEKTVDFDPGPNTNYLTSNGTSDIFIKKLDTYGNLIWVKQIGGVGLDIAMSIVKDANGDVIITGSFADTVDFNPNAGVHTLITSSMVRYGITYFYNTTFILKLSSSGTFIWAKSLDVAVSTNRHYTNKGNDITVDTLNNIYLTGVFQGSVDFDPGTAVNTLTSGVGLNPFVLKLNSNGQFIWAKEFKISTPFTNVGGWGNAIHIDPSGNVLTTGIFDDTCDFNPGSGVHNLIAWGRGDIYISKLSSTGNFVWAVRVGQSNYDYGADIITDSLGSVYTVGAFQDYTDFDPGSGTHYRGLYSWNGGFLLKLDSNAAFTWVETFNGFGESIDQDKFGNFIFAGAFKGIVDFDPTSKTKNLNSGSTPIQFIKKLDGNQNVFWAKYIPVVNYGNWNNWAGRIPNICVDSLESIFLSGSFHYNSGFDPNSRVLSHVPQGNGRNLYEMKLCQCTNDFTEIKSDSLVCQNDSTVFSLKNAGQYDSVLWDFGDPNALINQSWSDTAGHIFSDSGSYDIKASVFCKCIVDTIRLHITVHPQPTVVLGNDTTLCEGDSIQLIQFDSTNQYLWGTGDTSLSIQIFTVDTFTIQAYNMCGVAFDTIVIDSVIPALVKLPQDTILCLGDTLTLNGAILNGTYLWSNGTTDSIYQVVNSGVYSVTATNICGADHDSITVFYLGLPSFSLGADTVLCSGDSLTLIAYDTLCNYLWSTGSVDSNELVKVNGVIQVTVTNQCGQISDTIQTSFLSPPLANLGTDTVVCFGDTIRLSDTTLYGSYLWSDGSSGDSLLVDSAGLFSLIKSNMCGVDTDSIFVRLEAIPIVDLGNDTSLCEGNTLTLNPYTINSNYLWSNGRVDSTLIIGMEGSYWVQVTNVCGVNSDSIYLNMDSLLNVSLGTDTVLCVGDSLWLYSKEKGSSYLWSSGSVSDSLLVTQPDTYSLTVQNVCGSFTDEIKVYFDNSPVTNLGPDSLYCISNLINLNAYWNRAKYLWNTNDTSSMLSPNSNGVYSVKVTNLCGYDGDTVEIRYDIPLAFNLGLDTLLCEGDSIVLKVKGTNAQWLWSDYSVDSFLILNSPGHYYVSGTNKCGSLSDSIRVKGVMQPIINPVIRDTSFCEGMVLDVQVNLNNADFIEWDNGSTFLNREITEAGTYSYKLGNSCGELSESFLVNVNLPANIDLGYDTVICYGEEVTRAFYFYNHTYKWNDGSTDSIRVFNSQGTYGVTVITDKNCESYDEFEIRNCESPIYVPNAFSPGTGDNINEIFYAVGEEVYKFRMEIYNRWGTEVFRSENILDGWDGSVNGQMAPAGVYVYKIWYNIGLGPNSITKIGEVVLVR